VKLLRAYNYLFLCVLTGSISIVFLPRQIQRHLDGIIWEYPLVAVATIFLTVLFLMLNRHAVISGFSETAASPAYSTNVSGYYIFTMIGLSLAAFWLYAYGLGNLNFWDDEFLVLKAAEGYRQTGTYFFWDFIREEITQTPYERAWPHLWLVAQSYKLFGVSEWSSRIVSVLFGSIFVFSSFFAVFYFTKNAPLAMIVALVFSLNPDFIYFFRYTRMYAIVIPLFLIWSVSVFQAVEGQQLKTNRLTGKSSRIYEYLNFDYRFILVSLLLLFWAYHIQATMLLIVLVALVYILLMAIMHKEKKYLGLTILLISSVVIAFIFLPRTVVFKYSITYLAFFKSIKPLFFQLLVQKPFSAMANLMLLAGSITLIFICPEKPLKKKLIFCQLMVIVAVFFFVFMVDYHSQHFRYICHVAPFAILLICLTYWEILKVFQSRYILVLGLFFLLAAQTVHLAKGIPVLYHGAKGQPWPSAAYAAVRDNFMEGDVIFAQYLRDYYMRGIPKDTPVISLGQVRQDVAEPNPYHFELFYKDIRRYSRGWVIWSKYKEYHVHPQIVAYVKTLFHKVHGDGVDDTNVEVYFFDESMIKRAVFE
jgi:hypothetical protein